MVGKCQIPPAARSARPFLAAAVLAAALLAILIAADPALAQRGRRAATPRLAASEVLIEGGALQPLGDLKAGYDTPAGFGAELGYDVGFRYRQLWPSGWALSPSFHYQKLGKYTGHDAGYNGGAGSDFDVETSMFHYGVDLQYVTNLRGAGPKLIWSGGVALVRDRFREEYLEDGSFFETGVNSLALAAGLGLRQGGFEFSVAYTWNRPNTEQFWEGISDYDWDSVFLRLGFALPRYD